MISSIQFLNRRLTQLEELKSVLLKRIENLEEKNKNLSEAQNQYEKRINRLEFKMNQILEQNSKRAPAGKK